MSVLDFSELLQGNTSALSAGLLNDESFVFGGDETLATVGGGGLMDESMLELEDVPDEAVPEQEEVVEPLVVLEPVVEPIQGQLSSRLQHVDSLTVDVLISQPRNCRKL